jgi:hypothetical protein
MLVYIHPDCGKSAFLLVQMPKPFAQAQSANARHVDGRRIQPGSAPICDSCGGMVWGFKTANVRPMNERQLVSRNKREGWYRGRILVWDFDTWESGPPRHTRTRRETMALRRKSNAQYERLTR